MQKVKKFNQIFQVNESAISLAPGANGPDSRGLSVYLMRPAEPVAKDCLRMYALQEGFMERGSFSWTKEVSIIYFIREKPVKVGRASQGRVGGEIGWPVLRDLAAYRGG